MTLAKFNNSVIPTVFDRFFDDNKWFAWPAREAFTNAYVPAVNIKETENGYSIEVAAPGMKKEDFNISIDRDRLSISAETKSQSEKEDEMYSRREFSYQSFSRSFALPESTVDQDKITAQYKDGILYVELPKREEVKPKPARTIDIF